MIGCGKNGKLCDISVQIMQVYCVAKYANYAIFSGVIFTLFHRVCPLILPSDAISGQSWQFAPSRNIRSPDELAIAD